MNSLPNAGSKTIAPLRRQVISVGVVGMILVGLGTALRFVIPMLGGTDLLDSRTKPQEVGAWFLVPIVIVTVTVGGLFCFFSFVSDSSKVGRRAGLFGLALLMLHSIDMALVVFLHERTLLMLRLLQGAAILWCVLLLMQIDFVLSNSKAKTLSPSSSPLCKSSRVILTIGGILLLATCVLSGIGYLAFSNLNHIPPEEVLVSYRGAWVMLLFVTATALFARQSLGIVFINTAAAVSFWTNISFIPLVSVVLFNIVGRGPTEFLILRVITVASNVLLAAFVSWKLWPAVVATWLPVISPSKELRPELAEPGAAPDTGRT